MTGGRSISRASTALRPGGQDTRRESAGPSDESPAAMTDPRRHPECAGPRTRREVAAGSIVDLGGLSSTARTAGGPASSGARSGARPRACATDAGMLAMVLLIIAFGYHRRRAPRPRRAGRRRRAGLLGGRPDLARRRRPVPPDRAVPALRLCAVDAAAVRAVGAAAVGRRLVRLARRDDPAAALDDPLGLPAATARRRRRRRRCWPSRSARTSTPATSRCCSR